MTPNGERVMVVPAHRAYAVAMTEDDPLTAEESERLKAALSEMDTSMRHSIHYGLGEGPFCGEEPVGAHWSDELEAVAGYDDCLELVAEDLADDNDYQGRCFHCRQVITAKGGAQWRKVVRRPCPHCGQRGW
jgi:hypothetical protein